MNQELDTNEHDDIDVNQESDTQEIKNDSPPGYKSYDDYIAEGGDPDRFKGKKAYIEHYELMQDKRQLKNDYKDLSESVTAVLDQQKQMVINQYEDKIAELKEKLAAQEEDLDVKGALHTQNQINRIESQKNAAAEKSENKPVLDDNAQVLAEFISDNPVIDMRSPEFNNEVFQLVQKHVAMGEHDNMNPAQVASLLSKSLIKAVTTTTKTEKQPRKARSTGQTPSKGVQNTKPDPSKLDVTGRAIYDNLLSRRGEKAAEKFLNTQFAR